MQVEEMTLGKNARKWPSFTYVTPPDFFTLSIVPLRSWNTASHLIRHFRLVPTLFNMEEGRDWEDAAFNTRHLHNRNDRGGRGKTRAEFEIRNTFGTFLLKCVALEQLQHKSNPGEAVKTNGRSGSGSTKKSGRSNSNSDGAGDVVLEIYRLTDGEDGILGSLKCPGVFEATVVFAGSRKLLAKITRHLEQADSERQGRSVAEEGQGSDEDAEDENEHGASSSEGDLGDGTLNRESRQRRRVATFEKNSFRQPKFWFRWQGVIDDEETTQVHGSGYVVFSGNDCKRFQGTMTSEQLGWNNVKMNGWKTRPQPERDFEIRWQGQDA